VKKIDFLLGKAQRIAETYFFLTNAELSNEKENAYMISSRMILAGQSIELFLNGLNLLSDPNYNSRSERHELNSKFSQLPDNVKSMIKKDTINFYTKNTRSKPIQINDEEFDIMLKNSKGILLQFRYLDEQKNYDQAMNIHPWFVHALILALYDFVAKNSKELKELIDKTTAEIQTITEK
jgi:hypothetical protein